MFPTRLHRELKASIQGQLEAVQQVSRADTSVIEEHQLIENLQKQVQLITEVCVRVPSSCGISHGLYE